MKTIDKDIKQGKNVAERNVNDSFTLPSEFNQRTYEAAVKLDHLFGNGESNGESFQNGAEKVRRHHLNHLEAFTKLPSILAIGWPSSLYIPAKADWRKYWFTPAPADHLYSDSWTPQPHPAGYNSALKDEGSLYCIQRIRTIDRFVSCEAGIGALFSPKPALSVVSLQPTVNCSGEHRWYAEFDRPVAGSTWMKINLVLAAWQQIPGASKWDLLNWKQYNVVNTGPNSGLGHGAITPYQRFFAGQDLATPFMVQSGRTYLFGIVARVSIWSTLTDDRGHALPLIENGTFRVWGSLACLVPQIEIFEQQVYIK